MLGVALIACLFLTALLVGVTLARSCLTALLLTAYLAAWAEVVTITYVLSAFGWVSARPFLGAEMGALALAAALYRYNPWLGRF